VIPLFLRISFFFLSTFSALLLTDGYVMHGVLSAEVTTLFNLENHSKTYVLPIFCSSDTTFSIFRVSVAVFPSLKQSLLQTNCSFISTGFWVNQNHKWNNTHLFLTRHYSTITPATAIFHAGKDSANYFLAVPSGRGLCW
jgi:hypothetical protein